MRLFSKIFLSTTLLSSGLLGSFGAPLHAQSGSLSDSGVLLDRIVAVVDDGVVLQSELEDRVARVTEQLRAQGTRMPPAELLRDQILESLVVQQVQMQRAARLGIRISDEQLNLALERVAARNEIPFANLPATLASEGIDYTAFREDLRREMTIEALRQRDVNARIQVSESEIERWLEQNEANVGNQLDYDVSQILIALPANPNQEQLSSARKRADEVYARLQAGDDFAELAVAESAGQQALSGGRLGWRRGSRLPQQFAGAIQSLSAGEVSAPIQSSSGFHIFRVNEIRGGDERVVQMQTRARHILLTTNEVVDDETVRGRLEEFRARIEAGEAFADIATLESEDPGSAVRGGDLGWNPPGTFVPQFDAALAQLEPGEISEPFRSPFGWHIILLEDRQERDTTDEVKRRQAIEAIRASKQEQETELWLRSMRDEAWVEIRGG
ncbi:peptidylprolyl isomerase [Wenzhouxiangella sp. XN24]|uniref:peptidylprolyl isomerase n=1 Tax=Wenzhouxiangella sp. XN24 TaxID=2713569 RepID=UPI0013EB7C79|nr:peptidylprolyl isomerase [Wenzhouxiangella sp. XN24]NGX15796.1 molecular chaperone SurA [Wenzhouxiangella sp. XN24]